MVLKLEIYACVGWADFFMWLLPLFLPLHGEQHCTFYTIYISMVQSLGLTAFVFENKESKQNNVQP